MCDTKSLVKTAKTQREQIRIEYAELLVKESNNPQRQRTHFFTQLKNKLRSKMMRSYRLFASTNEPKKFEKLVVLQEAIQGDIQHITEYLESDAQATPVVKSLGFFERIQALLNASELFRATLFL